MYFFLGASWLISPLITVTVFGHLKLKYYHLRLMTGWLQIHIVSFSFLLKLLE